MGGEHFVGPLSVLRSIVDNMCLDWSDGFVLLGYTVEAHRLAGHLAVPKPRESRFADQFVTNSGQLGKMEATTDFDDAFRCAQLIVFVGDADISLRA